MGEELKMPNVATWWCGQPNERGLVERNLGLPGAGPGVQCAGPGVPVRSLRLRRPTCLPRKESACCGVWRIGPADFVGQEIVRLSTTPVLRAGELVPAPFVLRVFAAATPDGMKIMPGGFCRTSDRPDVRAISMDEKRADRRRLGDLGQAGREGDPAREQRRRPGAARPRQPSQPRRPTICSGLAATSSGRRRTLRMVRCLCTTLCWRSGPRHPVRPPIAAPAQGAADRLGRARRGQRRRLTRSRLRARPALHDRPGERLGDPSGAGGPEAPRPRPVNDCPATTRSCCSRLETAPCRKAPGTSLPKSKR